MFEYRKQMSDKPDRCGLRLIAMGSGWLGPGNPWVCVMLCAWLACMPGASASEIRVVDDEGQNVTLHQPARRIISLAPHVTELLFTAGAGTSIVGTTQYSDFPAAALAIPRIGDSFTLDSERVLSLHPDLIVVWLHGNPAGQLDQLRRMGIPVFSSEPRGLADISATIRRFGQLAGTKDRAEQAATAFDERVATLRARYAGRPTVRAFYQISERPLLTINDRHLIADVLRLCGGRNVFSELAPLTPSVSAEAVLATNPEVIITSGGEPGNKTGFEMWTKLPSLLATKRHNFVLLHSDTISRQSDRILEGAQMLCDQLEMVRAKRGP